MKNRLEKNRIINLCHQIIQRDENRLDPKRTKLFGELISFIKKYDDRGTDNVAKQIRKQRNIAKLREVFSLEQMCIEKHWAQKIISSKDPLRKITLFPFYQGYVATAEYLYNSIAAAFSKPIGKVLYIGSGALPLNSIILAQKYQLKIDNIEKDYESYKLSLDLLYSLKLSDKIHVICTDSLDYRQMKNYDVIICAILVGNTAKQRQDIIDHISKYMKSGSFIVIKNVDGMRTLLYPPINTKFFRNFSIEIVKKKQTEITNILIVARKLDERTDRNRIIAI